MCCTELHNYYTYYIILHEVIIVCMCTYCHYACMGEWYLHDCKYVAHGVTSLLHLLHEVIIACMCTYCMHGGIVTYLHEVT